MRTPTFITLALCALLLSGCSAFNSRSKDASPSDSSRSLLGAIESAEKTDQGVVANPPARSIRFDGQEIILGSSTVQEMSSTELDRQLSDLLVAEKLFSARQLIEQNRSTAEQLLWKLAGQPPAQQKVQLITAVLSAGVDPAVSWKGWLAQAAMQRREANTYYSLRNAFAERLRTEQPTDQECEQLRTAAQAVKHPLATIDALHLFGVRELVAGRNAWAEALFRQAAEVAEHNRDYQRAASAWSMVVLTAQMSADHDKAEQSWQQSVAQQIRYEQSAKNKALHPFWARAAELQPTGVQWPEAVAAVLLDATHDSDCPLADQSTPELVVQVALASAAYSATKPQIALIHYKQAEQQAAPEQVMWLKIAQGRCLASLGQTSAAAALLSSPASQKNGDIAAAAKAAIGSAKLQSGAYQQGAQLLHKSLSDNAGAWPSRSQSEADLALAMLIIGDTDEGLARMVSVQKTFESEGNIVALLRSLENQLELAQHEEHTDQVEQLRERIRELERNNS